MDTQFYILVSIKTPTGIESFGKFFIGNNRERADIIFNNLHGSGKIDGEKLLYMEFMEIVEGLPVNLKIIHCNLNQLTENFRLITKEIFKFANL
jgi:hypothetical protein